MKKHVLIALALAAFPLLSSSSALAHTTTPVTDDHTTQEEAEGKAVWQKLQSKEIQCADLSDADYGALGEYFMGQMVGDAHAAMNEMMIRMMGEEGEEQMHVVMGKRLSGCDPTAAYPVTGRGFTPMMGMMMGGGMNMMNLGYNTSFGGGWGMPFFGWFGGLMMVFWWALIIGGVVLFIRWLFRLDRQKGEAKHHAALDILQQRYAKGEINKQEFEEKKKDLIS